MNDAQITAENSRRGRDAELQRLLDSCPDEVLILLLQLLQEREEKSRSPRPSAGPEHSNLERNLAGS